MGLNNGTVHLENNYLIWKNMFNTECNNLRKIFKNIEISIEHVGSTSVKDLSAKPIVDIAIGINNFFDIDKVIEELKKIYTIKVNKVDNEILLIKEDDKETYFIIHILEINSERYKNMILLRDILNKDSNIKKEYEILKQSLAKKYYNDRKMYTKAKNDFIQKIIEKNNNN